MTFSTSRDTLRRALAFRPLLASTLSGEGKRLCGALAVSLAGVILEIARPWPIKMLFDDFLLSGAADGRARPPLALVIGAIVALPAAIGQVSLWRTVLSAEIGRRVTTRVRRQLFDHLLRLDPSFHQQHRQGDLLLRVTSDVSMLRDLLFASWIQIISRGALLLGLAAIMGWLSPDLAVVAFLPSFVLIVLVGRSSRKIRQHARKQRDREGTAAALVGEALHQICLVKSLVAETHVARIFARNSRQGERSGSKAARASGAAERNSEVLAGLGLGALLTLGAHKVSTHAMSPGELLVFLSYARSLYKPLRSLAREGVRLGKASACAQRVLAVLQTPPEPGSGDPAPEFRGHVECVGLTFRHPGRAPLLAGIDLDIPSGCLAVLSGPNGAGKSTLGNLLLRLASPDSGRILIDGRDIREFDLASYRGRCAYVPQDIRMFSATLAENIRLGKPDASDEAVLASAQLAELGPLLERLPEGLETMVGENGSALSGGEARRVMLARAAIRDARVLILDEPLTGIDEPSRPLVAAAIRRMSRGRTTIVITHGGSELFDPDLELLLNEGSLVVSSARSNP